MSLTITAPQRDALYDQLLDRLSGIGDIEMKLRAGSYEEAEQIGREYCDDLRLLLDDLGIGEGDGRSVRLSTPPEVLRRVLPRLHRLAEGQSAGLEEERNEVRELDERNRLVVDACRRVLAHLDGAQTGR